MPQDMRDEAPNIFPYLRYRDAHAALEWLATAFGFEKTMEVAGPDGTIAHAELSFGSGVIMVGTASDEQSEKSPRDLPATPGGVYVYVDDVDAHYERAKSAGAEIVRELEDTDYGSREYSARDLEGHHWAFGTYRPSSGG